jgi:hypothetical protein
MIVLHLVYAFFFFAFALTGSLLCRINSKIKPYRERVFLAVLGFGVGSYISFIAFMLAVSQLPFTSHINGQLRVAASLLAYLVPGILSSWFCIKRFG